MAIIYLSIKPWLRLFGGIKNKLEKVPDLSHFKKKSEAYLAQCRYSIHICQLILTLKNLKKYHNATYREICTEQSRDKMSCSLEQKRGVENLQICRSEKYDEKEY